MMNPRSPSLILPFLVCWTLLAFGAPPAACAYNILFYYNSNDGTDGALLECVTILQNAGHHVTTVDMGDRNRDPQNDNWGAPYDQVWDMRFVDRNSSQCGSGRPQAADYFDDHWRSKAVSFLNHCGKLLVAGEYYFFTDRDEGLYPFLKEIQAVKSGFDSCPPSERGNDSTSGEAFYPVHNGLGPVSFYGDQVGGIPLAYLTGTSFVDTRDGWEDDEVDRSVVSGWLGNQLGGAVTSGFCGRGKLFMVWDATMWTLWQPGMYEEGDDAVDSPIWDDSAWAPGNIHGRSGTVLNLKAAKRVTRSFFPAVARWLGAGGCPCTETSVAVFSPPPRGRTTSAKPIASPPAPWPSIPVNGGSLLSVSGSSAATMAGLSAGAPATLVFSVFPVNIYMGFRDGVGDYQLNIWDSHGNLARTVFDKNVTTEKESWATWDGKDAQGEDSPPGLYFAVLSKDGRLLRKIVLMRVKP